MIDVWLGIWLVVGGALALTVEGRRRARLRLRIVQELDALAAAFDRRRAQLVHLGVQLPEVLPACHAALEVLGRSHRACADALLGWRRRPHDAGAAAALVAAEERWCEALEELRLEAPPTPAFARLLELGLGCRLLRASAEDALLHCRVRSGRGPVRAG